MEYKFKTRWAMLAALLWLPLLSAAQDSQGPQANNDQKPHKAEAARHWSEIKAFHEQRSSEQAAFRQQRQESDRARRQEERSTL